MGWGNWSWGGGGAIIAIYAPMIYTAPCGMVLMRAGTLLGQVGEGWALEMESFLSPVKWYRADRLVPFGAQKTREGGTHCCPQQAEPKIQSFLKVLEKVAISSLQVQSRHRGTLLGAPIRNYSDIYYKFLTNFVHLLYIRF